MNKVSLRTVNTPETRFRCLTMDELTRMNLVSGSINSISTRIFSYFHQIKHNQSARQARLDLHLRTLVTLLNNIIMEYKDFSNIIMYHLYHHNSLYLFELSRNLHKKTNIVRNIISLIVPHYYI